MKCCYFERECTDECEAFINDSEDVSDCLRLNIARDTSIDITSISETLTLCHNIMLSTYEVYEARATGKLP